MIAFVLCFQAQAAKSRLEILPVKIDRGIDGQITLWYQPPCNSKTLGPLVRETKDSEQSIVLGVVVRRPHARCSRINGWKSVAIPGRWQIYNRRLVSFNPSIEPLQYKMLKVDQVHERAESDTTLLYKTSCNRQMGVLYKTNPQTGKTNVRVIEAKGYRLKPCKKDSLMQAALAIPAFIDETLSPDRKNTRPLSLHQRIIRPGSLGKVPGQPDRVEMQYMRQCNEAPVGLITRRSKGENVLSILVARYPESICPKGVHRQMWTRYESRLLKSPESQRLLTQAELRTRPLQLLPTESVRKKKGSKLVMKAFAACMDYQGVVIAEKGQDALVGILSQDHSAKPCKKKLERVSFKKGYGSVLKLSKSELHPLTIVGS